MERKLYQAIASSLQARENCIKAGNAEWRDRHEETLKAFQEELPSGSGIDNATQIDLDASRPERIVLNFAYHHMNDGGMYDGWTEHTAIITPSLAFGFNMRITGRDRNSIKEYLHDILYDALTATVTE